jgi:16S rRNA (cytosine1402-N4)-methyltransferase
MTHIPVLLPEVLAALAPAPGDVVIDGTFGGGGYTRAILETGARVIGLDRDPQAVARGRALEQALPGRFTMVDGPFSQLDAACDTPVQGVVLDIGVSSFQIDEGGRGFSFQKDGPLDMRMSGTGEVRGSQGSVTAAEVLAVGLEGELAAIFQAYGEERDARRIARAIVQDRETTPFASTLQLAGLIERLAGRRGREAAIHPATRVFQALRIYVNDELRELELALAAAERVLAPGGRLVVVSFHSLEDRIVKQFIAGRSGAVGGSRHMPGTSGPAPTFTVEGRKPVSASDAEAEANPRARSARLRCAIRTQAPPQSSVVNRPAGVPALELLDRRVAR